MRCLISGRLACTLALGLLAGLAGCTKAAESPFIGKWVVHVMLTGQEADLFLVEITDVDGKLQGKVLSAGIEGLAKDAKVDKLTADGDSALHITVSGGGQTFPADVYAPKGDAKPAKLLGSAQFRGRQFARLDRSDLKEIDPKKALSNSPSVGDLGSAMQKAEAKEKQTALTKLLAKKDLEPQVAYVAGLELLAVMAENDADKDAVAKQAEETIKAAAAYGPDMKLDATQNAAKRLAASEKLAPVAVDLARQAEKALDKATPVDMQVAVLGTLKTALQKAGKTAEAKELSPKIETLNDQLDREFLKDAVPFKTEPVARKSEGSRVVLCELFTGAQCPPCVAADVAFDGLLKTYEPTDVVFLQYHLHIPGPDALTNEDSIKRMQFYGLGGTPSLYIDGDEGPQSGGGKADAKEKYGDLVKSLGDALAIGAQAKIQLSAKKKDAKIDVHAEVSDLSKTGDDVRLRLVLVEEIARYPGSNGQRLHHHVVRGFPGGVEGFALTEKNTKQDVRINLDEVRKGLNDYLAGYQLAKFPEDERSLDLKKLKLVAFIQKNRDKAVYQAAQIDLPDEK